MLGTTYLNEIISLNDDISPADFLEELRSRIIKALAGSEQAGTRDGLDISMIRLNAKTLVGEWAGANNPLWIIRDKITSFVGSGAVAVLDNDSHQLIELKPDKQPIGLSERILPFRNHRIQLEKNDVLYMFSDGYSDQFGGTRGKKYKTLNFKRKTLELAAESMEDQLEILQSEFDSWKGDHSQVDDVCVFGFRV
jgi:hypothetical protein